ncbi:ATP-binding protein [Corynebacterium genitalium ATCC 33030]|uniref:ATP-binding protein n=1 Tax=Corynebacterium genitalium TaxID=38288 RepID=UPI000308DB7E|nr:ATP-binding protein [Corynebacterium genitalium]UUA89310.1 ATP-binding protein [Corynebacterium genitalium ATCC 33030]
MTTAEPRPRNPFTATVGKTPPVLAGREGYLRDFDAALYDGPGSHERISIVTGPRGIGKTVLLNEFENIAKSHAWHVISETTTKGFNERIRDKAFRLLEDISNAPQRQISGITGPFNLGMTTESVDAFSPEPTLRSVLEELLDQQREIDMRLGQVPVGVLITLDELHYAHMDEVIEFGTTIQHLVREDREIAVAMAGIPGAVKPLLAADEGRNPVTFLRRANRIETGMVALSDVQVALQRTSAIAGVDWTQEAVETAASATGGYPFMIQLVGQHAFRNQTGNMIDETAVNRGIADARRKLGQLVHEPSLADLSEVDRTFLTAMSVDDNPSRMSDIAARMGVDAQYAGNYRKRLIDAEMIRATSHGFVDYELPYMREYLRSHQASEALEQFAIWPE